MRTLKSCDIATNIIHNIKSNNVQLHYLMMETMSQYRTDVKKIIFINFAHYFYKTHKKEEHIIHDKLITIIVEIQTIINICTRVAFKINLY